MIQTNIDFGGAAVAGQQVSVFLHGTQTLASIFDVDGVTALANPLPIRGNGHVIFSANPGTYDVVGVDRTRTVVIASQSGSGTYSPRRTLTAANAFPRPSYANGPTAVGIVGSGGSYMVNSPNTLLRSVDYGTTTVNVSVPANVTNAFTSCQQMFEWNGYVYAIFQDSSDSAYKLYRAAITSGSTALTWSAPLLVLTTGATGFGYTITGTSQVILVAEYGDPLISATKTAHIWRSTDGTTFTVTKTYGSAVRHIHCVSADPYNDGQVLASIGDGVANCYSLSTDHGATWTDLPIDSSWQGTQITWGPDYAYVAPDAVSQASLYVLDRTTWTPKVGCSSSHRQLRIMNEGTYYDGSTTNTSTTFTTGSPDFAGVFSSADIGRKIVGSGIPNGTTITAVASGGSCTLSAPATATATQVTFTIDRKERPAKNCFMGAVDPATGIYYGVANDDSGSEGGVASRRMMFAVPSVGAPAMHIADLTTNGAAVLIAAGKVLFGQTNRSTISSAYEA